MLEKYQEKNIKKSQHLHDGLSGQFVQTFLVPEDESD